MIVTQNPAANSISHVRRFCFQAGGALLFTGSSFANITNAIFHLNTAARYGGAIAALDGASFVLSESHVGKNNATLIGGAVYLNAAVGRVKAVWFDGNAVTEGR